MSFSWLAAAAALPAAPVPENGRPEFAEAQAWFDRFAAGRLPGAGTPFRFDYDGKPSAGFLATWPAKQTERALDARRDERVVTLTDPHTGLEIRCVAVAYRDFPTVEWTVYFKNTGAVDTPILSSIQAIDAQWTGGDAKEYVLHHPAGTIVPLGPMDFMPLTKTFAAGESARLVPMQGRPTGGLMPYFNLERGDGSGVILALGWTGSWAVEIARDAAKDVRVVAGQEITHLTLHPGEEIRTPLVVLQFWRGGDWIDAQNVWRRWMLAHNVPRLDGRLLAPLLAASSSSVYEEMTKADEASQLRFIDRYAEEKIPLDVWWMDAGWYENNGRWQQPKAFRVDRARFPRGLRAVTDYMHARGLKSVVWFEPERVMPDNELAQQHPEWLLRNPTPGLISKLLYLGNPAAREWLTDLIDRRITEEGIDIYRQDFCILEPRAIWHQNDAPDRQGITENHHITGYLAFWDELRRRHPNLVIDSCAGGGSRNDLETLRRALPFWRSDYCFDVVSNQTQTYGLALWMPYFGTANGPTQFSPYELRSNATSPIFIFASDVRDPKLPYDVLRRAAAEWRSQADNLLGDFYPLTPCSLGADVWIAWQFDRPEAGRGMIQAFRRAESAYTTAHFKLRGLDVAARYRFTNLDQPQAAVELTGKEAREAGLDVAIGDRPGAAIIAYETLPAKSEKR